MDAWAIGIKDGSDLSNLKNTAEACDLCRLLYQGLLKEGQKDQKPRGKVKEHNLVGLHRQVSTLKRPDGLPLFSIYAEPGT